MRADDAYHDYDYDEDDDYDDYDYDYDHDDDDDPDCVQLCGRTLDNTSLPLPWPVVATQAM